MFEVGNAGDLRELARRLAMTFGVDAGKHQTSILLLHREGIAYSLLDGETEAAAADEPPNLLFLDILKEFVSRLTAKVSTGFDLIPSIFLSLFCNFINGVFLGQTRHGSVS
jgi:hypothetical protein